MMYFCQNESKKLVHAFFTGNTLSVKKFPMNVNIYGSMHVLKSYDR